MKLGIMTGLDREVRCLPDKDANIAIACSGANPERAEALAHDLVANGCGALLSFGIAGALAPELGVGDIIVSTEVIDPTGSPYTAAENWCHRVVDGLPKAQSVVKQGPICGSDTAIVSQMEKSRLHKKTGALCVDMESHRLAKVASAASLPFLAIRVISDDASRTLPSSAIDVIDENGRPILKRVLLGVLQNPGQIPALITLSRDMEVAIGQLRRVSSLISPLFRFA